MSDFFLKNTYNAKGLAQTSRLVQMELSKLFPQNCLHSRKTFLANDCRSHINACFALYYRNIWICLPESSTWWTTLTLILNRTTCKLQAFIKYDSLFTLICCSYIKFTLQIVLSGKPWGIEVAWVTSHWRYDEMQRICKGKHGEVQVKVNAFISCQTFLLTFFKFKVRRWELSWTTFVDMISWCMATDCNQTLKNSDFTILFLFGKIQQIFVLRHLYQFKTCKDLSRPICPDQYANLISVVLCELRGQGMITDSVRVYKQKQDLSTFITQ